MMMLGVIQLRLEEEELEARNVQPHLKQRKTTNNWFVITEIVFIKLRLTASKLYQNVEATRFGAAPSMPLIGRNELLDAR